MVLIILLATSTFLIPLGLNQNQIAIAQQQKLQGLQNNQTSSSALTKQQQPTGISFEIDNMTFSHNMASVNGIQLHYEAAETVLGYFGFDRTAYGIDNSRKNRKWWHELREGRIRRLRLREYKTRFFFSCSTRTSSTGFCGNPIHILFNWRTCN
jgi:hypothetical protein